MAIATAVLEKAGHKTWLFDAAALNLSRSVVKKEVRRFNPEIAVIHTTTPSIYNDIDYAKLCKNEVGEDCLTILIGAHATACPDNTFKIAKGHVDAIARREYDYTLRDVADGKKFEEIYGLSYIKDGIVKHNPDRPPIINVDSLPFPAWHHIKPEWYWDGGKLYPFLTLISGRGCWGMCTFCRETQVMFGRKMRMRSPKVVVNEIEYDLRLFPRIKEIMFETDTLTADVQHVKGVCHEILERKLDITWSANARPDVTNPHLLSLMKKAGCRMLCVGFEFGTQEALNAVKKGVKIQRMEKFAEICHKVGIKVHGCFMIGAPYETREMALKTIELAKSVPIDTVQFSALCPYPGTEFYEWAERNGFIIARDWTEWVNEEYEQTTVISYPQLTKKDIDALVDIGLREFYLRPKKMISLIMSTRNLGDFMRKLYGLKSLVDYLFHRYAHQTKS